MTDAEAITAWLDRWDEHMDDKWSCEKCRHKRAHLTAVEALDSTRKHAEKCATQHGGFHALANGCELALAIIRKDLGIESKVDK